MQTPDLGLLQNGQIARGFRTIFATNSTLTYFYIVQSPSLTYHAKSNYFLHRT